MVQIVGPEPEQASLPDLPETAAAGLMVPRAVALAKATALPLPASPQHASPEAPARHSINARVSCQQPLAPRYVKHTAKHSRRCSSTQPCIQQHAC